MVALPALAAVFLLTIAYDNPHPWNNNVDYLRNLPLIAMSNSLRARFAAACLIVIVVPVIVRFTMDQPNRRMLALVWLLSVLFLLPHSLAEPRYYIVPAFFVNFFTRYTQKQGRSLTVWYATVSAAVAVYVCLQGRPEGGLW